MLERLPDYRPVGQHPESVPVGAAAEGMLLAECVDLLGVGQHGPSGRIVEHQDRVRLAHSTPFPY